MCENSHDNLTNFKGDFILPYSKLFQKKPDVSILRVFGSRGLGKRGNPANRKKFSAKAEECLFLGYDEESPSYLVQWKDRCFGKTRSLKLKENELVSTNVEEFVPKSAFMSSQKSPEFSLWYELFSLSAVTGEDFLSKEVPRSYFDIPYMKNFKEWKKSYDLEMSSFQRAGLRPVKPPPGVQILPLLEMFSIKYDALSGLLLPKSRFCIRGDKEKSEDGRKVGLYSPVVSTDVIRTLFCIVVLFALKIRQMDIRTAFLNGSTPKTYYVQLPLGHPLRKRGYVWASDVSVYGLRDSPFYWYQRLTSEFEKYGLKKFVLDGCVFTSSKLTVIVYVDDLLYVSKDERELDKFEAFLERVFSEKKTSNVQKFVGFEVRKK